MNASRRAAAILAACLLGFLLAACSSGPHYNQHGLAAGRGSYVVGPPYEENGVWYYPKVDYHYDKTGIASWYGPGYNLRPTANGEIFDMNEPSAAHPTLPLPSIVRVTNLDNGRSLELRVNDRGPFVDGRIIDLSRRAAHLLGFETAGTAPVRVKVMKRASIMAAELAMRDQTGPLLAENSAPPAMLAAGPPEQNETPPVMAAVETEPLAPALARAEPPAPPQRRPFQMAAAAPPPQYYASPQASPKKAGAAPPAPRHGFSLPALIPSAAAAELPNPSKEFVADPLENSGRFYIQAGAFSLAGNAERVESRIASLGKVEVVRALVNDVKFYRVRLGPIANRDEARQMLIRVIGSGYPAARIVSN